MTDFIGTAANDSFDGSSVDDLFYMQQGGDDDVGGSSGADGFYFGAALSAADIVSGGPGIDTLAIQGHYAGLVLGGVRDVEVLLALSGGDDRFGDMSGSRYSYGVATVDANVPGASRLTVQADGLLPGETFIFDGSAESDGHFRIYGGRGQNLLTGGSGNDGFLFGVNGQFLSTDRVHGGAGTDSLAFRGNYFDATALSFHDQSFTGIEVLVLLSGHTNEHGGFIDPNGFSYYITMADGNVEAGTRIDVAAGLLQANESVVFDGSAETDGSFRVIAGAGNDTLVGGAGDDLLYGQAGNDNLFSLSGSDLLDGGAGDDELWFNAGLDHFDTANGGDGTDKLVIAGRGHVDADFTNLSNLEILLIGTPGHDYILGTEAQQAGLMLIQDVSDGANVIDASAYQDYPLLRLIGGAGGDRLSGGSGQTNMFSYSGRSDSHVGQMDTITNFRSGVDTIDAAALASEHPALRGFTIEFKGNFATGLATEAALSDSSLRKLEAVFVTSMNTLWFDVDLDQKLTDADLAIYLPSVGQLSGLDLNHGATIF